MPTTFATVLNCMDGRVQRPVAEYLCRRFGVDCVDTITEAGIIRFLADRPDAPETLSALAKVRISTGKHASTQMAVAAHADCAGNPVSDQEQIAQVRRAATFLRHRFGGCEVVGLWLD
ncbi:MAG: hypothetical protein ISS74_09000, partial [Planctomycetes bacterium]|nr:hypothetical protein [Planctomycetota bacterium]